MKVITAIPVSGDHHRGDKGSEKILEMFRIEKNKA